MTDTDPARRLLELRAAAACRQIDTDRAWRQVRQRRLRARRDRRRWLAAGAAAVSAAAVATALPALAGLPATVSRGRPPVSGHRAGPGRSAAPARPYPGAVVARIPVAGAGAVVTDGPDAWTITSTGQLVRISLRTSRITLRESLSSPDQDVAAGGGRVWITTVRGQAAGQLQRLNRATGHVAATLHLPAGQCDAVTYGAGYLWAECGRGRASEVLRISPATGRVTGRAGPVRGAQTALVVSPQGVWYGTSASVSGLVGFGGRAHAVTVPAFPVSLAESDSLAYSQGDLWSFTSTGGVAAIDPATARVLVQLSPEAKYSGLDFFAAGQRSLWFLDDSARSVAVLRVAAATGRTLGRVPRLGSCGQPCDTISDTPGAVWVPTLRTLIRIDPARLPG